MDKMSKLGFSSEFLQKINLVQLKASLLYWVLLSLLLVLKTFFYKTIVKAHSYFFEGVGNLFINGLICQIKTEGFMLV